MPDSVHHHFSSGFLQQPPNRTPCSLPSFSPQFDSEFSKTNKSDQGTPLLITLKVDKDDLSPVSLPTLSLYLPPPHAFILQSRQFKAFLVLLMILFSSIG